MYTIADFDQRVKIANRGFTLKRSSLRPLYNVLAPYKMPAQAPIIEILGALRSIPEHKKMKYRAAIDYLLRQHGDQGTKPHNFNWLIPGIGGMSRFSTNGNLDNAAIWLYKSQVRTVISIERRGAEATKKHTSKTYPNFKWYSCYLADWHAPSVQHLQKYCETVSHRYGYGGIITHCAGGTGRTGCFLAAWSLFTGSTKSAQEALKYVRQSYNVHSVELKTQYNALARFADHLKQQPSKTFDDTTLDQAGGHWHPMQGNNSLAQDPGHAGSDGLIGNAVIDTMVGGNRATKSRGPYITESPTAKVQSTQATAPNNKCFLF